MRYVSKPLESVGSAEDMQLFSAGEWEQMFPAVVEYLVAGAYADGSPRERSTVLLLFEEGQWKVCLNDRAQGRSLWASSRTPIEALAALEVRLRDPSADWRKSRPRGKK